LLNVFVPLANKRGFKQKNEKNIYIHIKLGMSLSGELLIIATKPKAKHKFRELPFCFTFIKRVLAQIRIFPGPFIIRNFRTIYCHVYVNGLEIGFIELLRFVNMRKDYAVTVLHTSQVLIGLPKCFQSVTAFISRCLVKDPLLPYSRSWRLATVSQLTNYYSHCNLNI
jgi:hypothetical protein